MNGRLGSWLGLAVALLFLDASLTFENFWPTPLITWTGQISIELAVVLIALVVWQGTARPQAGRRSGWLSALWLVLVVSRYGVVTAPALYGRDVNLYWDLQFLPDVTAMVTHSIPFWMLVLGGAASLVVFGVLFLAIRGAIRRVRTGIDDRSVRHVLAAVALLAVIGFVAQEALFSTRAAWDDRRAWFPTPVTWSYVRQARLALASMTSPTELADSPSMAADLARLKNRDVYLVFIESYGAISWERPEFARELASSRTALETDIDATKRHVVSAYVESPTFGGNSWLAHISLLSGIEVRDAHTNAQLMQQQRETLATVFARAGYRTIALMPGLRRPWPEGRFYGFNETLTAGEMNYPGPDFGWFAVPDQVSLDWLDMRELEKTARKPAFVFFPTLTTHFPFSPRPPYQPDWSRLSTDHKYDGADIVRAYGEQLDWEDFGPAYVNAVAYIYQTIGGYLRLRADRDFVMILIGDHQPPAAVSGEGTPWDVPVHIITSDSELIDQFLAKGFRNGLSPARPTLSKTNELLPIFLSAFGKYQ
jgi:Sulfatase